jgi:hypothetical protein
MKALLYDKDGSQEFLEIRESLHRRRTKSLSEFTPYPSKIGIGGSFRTKGSPI